MTQSRYSVLVSLCLLLLLAGGFFAASRLVFDKLHTSIAAAVATATVVVLPPTPTRPPATATPHGTKHTHAQPTNTPEAGSAQVLIGTSANKSSAATTFPAATAFYYCMVDLPNLPLGTPITFKWASLPAGTGIFNYTGTYASTFKYSYVSGPEPPGQYRCQVSAPVNGSDQLLGAATFSVK